MPTKIFLPENGMHRTCTKEPISYTKEPGSWIMFVTAFAAGMWIGGGPRTITVIIFVSLSLFLLIKAPAVQMIRSGKPDPLPALAMLALPGAAGLAYSVWLYPPLSFLYTAGALLFALNYFFERKRGKPSQLYAQACGMAIMGEVAVISSSAAGAIEKHLYLWALFFLFYLASPFRVRFSSGVKKYRLIGGIYSGALLAGGVAGAALGYPALLAFLPLSEDVYSALTGRKFKLKQIGVISTIKTVIFAAVIVYLGK